MTHTGERAEFKPMVFKLSSHQHHLRSLLKNPRSHHKFSDYRGLKHGPVKHFLKDLSLISSPEDILEGGEGETSIGWSSYLPQQGSNLQSFGAQDNAQLSHSSIFLMNTLIILMQVAIESQKLYMYRFQ